MDVKEQTQVGVSMKTLYTKEELQELVHDSATKYGANEHQMFVTASCEAKKVKLNGILYYDSSAKSGHPGEESYGIPQWNLPSKNTNFEGTAVTHEQATDAEYSLDLMAHYFATGKKTKWTCYRTYFT